MIVPIKQLIEKAQRYDYAVPAFNTCNLETTLGIIRAAVAEKAPVIIQVSESTITYAGLETITSMIVEAVAEHGAHVPIALHLDHGHELKVIKECIAAGFSSVHCDASEKPYRDNITATKKAVAFAHSQGVWIQGELGSILGKEGLIRSALPRDISGVMTDPKQVPDYVTRTRVDTLAVSVGTLHGLFRGREKLDRQRLARIHELVPQMPLVLHGASGLSDTDLRGAVARGVRIVNIDTELRQAFTMTLQKQLRGRQQSYDPRKLLAPSIEAVTMVARQKIKTLGAHGRA